ncbi:unnamed protein product, partial [Rotaria sordida]
MQMSMATTTYTQSLLQKMSSNDKDLRFQAVANLMNDLRQQSFKLDDDSEYHVVQGVLKLLEDTNSEVLNQVVQCIALLLYK